MSLWSPTNHCGRVPTELPQGAILTSSCWPTVSPVWVWRLPPAISAWRPDRPTPRPGLPAQDRAVPPARPGACPQLTLSPSAHFRRYYKITSGLILDIGGYTKALEVRALGPSELSGLPGMFLVFVEERVCSPLELLCTFSE